MDKVQREITQETVMQELPFLHSAHRLILVDICMKFHDASLYGLKIIERTRRQDFGSKGNNSKFQGKLLKKCKCKSYGSCTLHIV